jgi:hypothetical protein
MLTILAWMIFIPAVFWNSIIFAIAVIDIIDGNRKYAWSKWRNWRDLMISLVILFIPGVYLFGWF